MGLIDLNAPWWDQNANESLSILNKVYFSVSDISIMQKIVSIAMMFNPDMLKEKHPDLNLFKMVDDKTWTMDYFVELCKEFTYENTGDNTRDQNDRWGLTSAYGDVTMFYFASGERLCNKNENDEPIIAIDSPRAISVAMSLLQDFQLKDQWAIHANDFKGVSDMWVESLAMFGDGRALFRTTAFSAVKKVRDYKVNYGILPIPLIAEAQTDYYTPCNIQLAYGIVIPTFVSDPEFSAYMIEMMSAGGKEYVAKAYYEQILKLKDIDDDESSRMLDLIFSNVVYDMGHIYGFAGLSTIISENMANGTLEVASKLEASKDTINSKIEEIVDRYKDQD